MSFKERFQGLTAMATFAISVGAAAAQPPSGEAANSVVDYYYSDASQPVLMEFKVCKGVYEKGQNQHNCKEEIPEGKLREGMRAYLWMKFLVPRQASPRVLMQLNHKGITRDTMNRELDGAVRYRTWNVADFSRSGDWVAQVFHESEDDVTELFSRTLKVQPKEAEAQTEMNQDTTAN